MRFLAVHTCPLWQEPDGDRTIGLSVREDHPHVVGWVNVGMIRIGGEVRLFLLTRDATDG